MWIKECFALFERFFDKEVIDVDIMTVGNKYGFPLFTQPRSTMYLLKNSATYVTDIWDLWAYIIRKKAHKSTELDFLQSLLEQAHYFYEAAEKAPFKSKPLLYYYSFLNLVKIILNIENFYGASKEYYHGIEVNNKGGKGLKVPVKIISMIDPANPRTSKLSVAYQFMKTMGVDVSTFTFPLYIKVIDLLSDCVGVHRTYCEINNEKEKFFRIDNANLFTERNNLKYEGEVHDCDNSIMAQLNTKYGSVTRRIIDGEEKFIWTETLNMGRRRFPNRQDIYMLSKQMNAKGLWPIMNGSTCLQYISSNNISSLPAEVVIYCLMFFFGSITRYQPYFFDNLLSDKEQWLVAEFLKSQPKQFLYLATSKILGKQIYKSMLADL